MTGRNLITVTALLLFSLNCCAHDSDRIDQLEKELRETQERISQVVETLKGKDLQLEKELRETQERISKLESILNQQTDEEKSVPAGNGWKSLSNWRKIFTGMRINTVRNILGEPKRINGEYGLWGGDWAYWYYENGGKVVFSDGSVHRFSEPD